MERLGFLVLIVKYEETGKIQYGRCDGTKR